MITICSFTSQDLVSSLPSNRNGVSLCQSSRVFLKFRVLMGGPEHEHLFSGVLLHTLPPSKALASNWMFSMGNQNSVCTENKMLGLTLHSVVFEELNRSLKVFFTLTELRIQLLLINLGCHMPQNIPSPTSNPSLFILTYNKQR